MKKLIWALVLTMVLGATAVFAVVTANLPTATDDLINVTTAYNFSVNVTAVEQYGNVTVRYRTSQPVGAWITLCDSLNGSANTTTFSASCTITGMDRRFDINFTGYNGSGLVFGDDVVVSGVIGNSSILTVSLVDLANSASQTDNQTAAFEVTTNETANTITLFLDNQPLNMTANTTGTGFTLIRTEVPLGAHKWYVTSGDIAGGGAVTSTTRNFNLIAVNTAGGAIAEQIATGTGTQQPQGPVSRQQLIVIAFIIVGIVILIKKF